MTYDEQRWMRRQQELLGRAARDPAIEVRVV